MSLPPSPAPAPGRGSLPLLFVARHAETAWSRTGQHTGRTDLPLTAHGEQSASQLSQWLGNIAFTRILTSPRWRARVTCSLAGLGDGAQIEPNLAEWDCGDYEGLSTPQIRTRHRDWSLWEHGCPGGETPAHIGERADRLIDLLRAQTGNVALFSHGQFGKVLAARWVGMPVAAGRHFVLAPASVSILGFDDSQPNCRAITLWNVVPADHRGGVRIG